MEITVYSKSGCPECIFTKKFLESANISFIEKRVDLNKNYLAEVLTLGQLALPVVKIDKKEIFSGYQPIKLKQLVKWCQKLFIFLKLDKPKDLFRKSKNMSI